MMTLSGVKLGMGRQGRSAGTHADGLRISFVYTPSKSPTTEAHKEPRHIRNPNLTRGRCIFLIVVCCEAIKQNIYLICLWHSAAVYPQCTTRGIIVHIHLMIQQKLWVSSEQCGSGALEKHLRNFKKTIASIHEEEKIMSLVFSWSDAEC